MQFRDPLIMLLLASAFVSVCMRQIDDAISITVVSTAARQPALFMAKYRLCHLHEVYRMMC